MYSRSLSVMGVTSGIDDNAFENQEKKPSSPLPILASMDNDDEWATKRPEVRRAFLWEFSRNATSMILHSFPDLINLALMGAFGDDREVAAIGLGNSVQNCIGTAVGYGLNSALDLFASTSVADKKHMGMLYLSRAFIATTLYYLLIFPIFWYTDEISLALGQDPTVSAYAADYNKASMIGVWFMLQVNGFNRFLINHGNAKFCARAKMSTCPLHFVWCYLFVGYLGYGNRGLGLANATTWVLQYIVYLSYFLYNRDTYGLTLGRYLYNFVSPDTWRGMGQYFGTAIPSAIMMASMWIWWEVLVFLVGIMGDHRLLAAHVTTLTMTGTLSQFNKALTATTSGYVGGAIGRGDAPYSRRLYAMTRNIGFVVSAIASGLLGVVAPLTATWFARDEATVEITKNTLRIASCAFFFSGCGWYLQGILRICRRADVVAVVSLVQNFVLSFSLVMLLSFYLHNGVYGAWAASAMSNAAGYFAFSFIVRGVSFDEEVEKARDRLQENKNQGKAPLLRK